MSKRLAESIFSIKKLHVTVRLVAIFSVLVAIGIAPELIALSNISEPASADSFEYVDLSYLAKHQAEFEAKSITTVGIVRHYGSVVMFEDFFLESEDFQGFPESDQIILIVSRYAGISRPDEGLLVEVSGIWEFYNIEGGHFFLNASNVKVI